jgi:fumarate hydratase, class I
MGFDMEFTYQDTFAMGEDNTEYRSLGVEFIELAEFDGQQIVKVSDSGLELLSRQAMSDANFLLRPAHQELVAKILADPESSDNDRFVARAMLENAIIAAEGVLPFCQDTGTATVYAKKGHQIWTNGPDEAAISRGIYQTYKTENLRYSQIIPMSMFDEKNSGTNMPAQIDIIASKGASYKFLFVAKGGGSANKTQLFQMTKAVLNPTSLKSFLTEKMKSLGTAACPPYHLAFVIGGSSAETVLKTVKLASTGWYDNLADNGNEGGRAFRDLEMEKELLTISQKIGLGAQFGGKYFCHDIRVIRLPRHGASCPIGMGVSCSADRNVKALINAEGIFVEKLEMDPAKLLAQFADSKIDSIRIDINQPMDNIRKELAKYPIKTMLKLNGKMIVARDMAHARFKDMLDNGEELPEYFRNHPVYYAGPAKTPDGMATGSFGPTTAQRMDPYVDLFQKNGASFVMIAKGNRSAQVTNACQENGGFYLGSPGGPAALLAKNHIKSQRVLDFPEFGMEAVWEIEVEDFPAFILVDDKGNDFFRAF